MIITSKVCTMYSFSFHHHLELCKQILNEKIIYLHIYINFLQIYHILKKKNEVNEVFAHYFKITFERPYSDCAIKFNIKKSNILKKKKNYE